MCRSGVNDAGKRRSDIKLYFYIQKMKFFVNNLTVVRVNEDHRTPGLSAQSEMNV
jgi:hypothetical protein